MSIYICTENLDLYLKNWYPVKCFSQGHNKQACLLCLHTILYAERQAGSCEYQFSEVFGMNRTGIELRVYRLGGERSTTPPTTGTLL